MYPENNKPAPELTDLINRKAGRDKAILKTLAYGSYYGSVVNSPTSSDPLTTLNYSSEKNNYTMPQETVTFDLWVTEVNYGYGLEGQNAASRYYNKFYSQYFRKDPIQVKGLCKDEAEYNDLANFIRKQQLNATLDYNNLFQLEVPGAGVRVIGVIPEFIAGIASSNKGIPVAPDFQFNFIVFRDLNDPNDSRVAKEQYQLSYFRNVGPRQIIGDNMPSYAIFSNTGDMKPFNLSGYKSPAGTGNRNPNSEINNGTNNARGS